MDSALSQTIERQDSALRQFVTTPKGSRTSNRAERPEDPKLAEPIRIWTGGPGSPQEKILLPNSSHGLKPRPDGSYLIETEAQLAAAKVALRSRWWEDTIPEDRNSLKCEGCQWTCRSYEAMNWHQNFTHGRPQFTG